MKNKIFIVFILTTLIFQSGFSHYFTENQGQMTDQDGQISAVLFSGQTPDGISIHLYKNYFSYELKKLISSPDEDLRKGSKPFKYGFSRVDLRLLNSNPDVKILTKEYLHYETYILSGKTNRVNTFKKVIYKNIYPSIDLEFIFNREGEFKYNFILFPGAKLEDIKIQIGSSEKPYIRKENILLKNTVSDIKENIPASWIKNGDQKKMLDINYREAGEAIFSFELDNTYEINPDDTLVIDPIPTRLFGTYAGGPQQEQVEDLVLDDSGNAYTLGFTQSTSNIATTGTYQGTFSAVFDVFIMKHDENGNKIWGTYYGGTSYDRGFGIAYRDGHVYIGGNTFSMNMATTGVHQENIVDSDEAYLAKFDTTGNLVWSTYYAGEMHDFFADVAIDSNGDIYCTGHTYSQTNIASSGAHQNFFLGSSACFVVKFDDTGNRIWGTYYGTTNEEGWGVAVDSDDNLYVTGYTTSSNGIINPSNTNVHQTSYNAGADVFIGKFNPSGSLEWGTYYGGSGNEIAYDIDVDANDSIYVAGNTTSSANIHYTTGFQSSPSSIDENFVAKFGSDGNISWGTYFGGNEAEYLKKIDVHPGGGVVIAGFTQSQSNISTSGAYQSDHSGNYDAYMTYLDGSGSKTWSSYYGGVDADEGRAIAIRDDNLQFYLSGVSSSLNNIASVGAEQTSFAGGTYDAFLAKFCSPVLPELLFNGETEVCGGDSAVFILTNSQSFSSWQWSNSSTNDSLMYSNSSQGTFDVYITTIDTNNCPGFSDTVTINVYPDNSILFTGVQPNYCAKLDSIMLGTDFIYDSYSWSTGGSNDTILITDPSNGGNTISLTATDNFGCTYNDSVEITINPSPNASLQVNGSANFCIGETVDITLDQNYDSYLWHNGSTTALITLTSESWVWAIVSNNFGCVDTTDSVYVDSDFLDPVISFSSVSPYCKGDTIILETTFNYDQYEWFSGNTSANDTLFTSMMNPGSYDIFVEVTNACGSVGESDTTTIEIFDLIEPDISVLANNPLCINDTYEILINNNIYDQYFWDNTAGTNVLTEIASNSGIQNHLIEIIDSNGCLLSDTVFIEIDSCFLNILSEEDESIIIYPNPSDKYLMIECRTGSLNDMQIYNIKGQEIKDIFKQKSTSKVMINTSQLTNGKYFIKVGPDSNQKYFSFIVNH